MHLELSDILKACRRNDVKAQRWLFDHYYRQMLNVCIRYVKDEADAEDMLSQGFTKVFKNLDRFTYEHEYGLRVWIKTIMIHECLMFLRKRNNFLLVPISEAGEVGSSDLRLDEMDAAYIFQQIATLPVGYRTVFNLYVVEGYSHAEIATLLQIKEATSRSQLNKARELLKTKLSTYKISQYGKR